MTNINTGSGVTDALHAFNECCDYLTNDIQRMRNVRDGIGKAPSAYVKDMEQSLEEILALVRPACKALEAASRVSPSPGWAIKAVEDAQAILVEYIVPDSGISDFDCVNRLLGVLDDQNLVRAQRTPSVPISRGEVVAWTNQTTLANLKKYGTIWRAHLALEPFTDAIALYSAIPADGRDAGLREALEHFRGAFADTLMSPSYVVSEIEALIGAKS